MTREQAIEIVQRDIERISSWLDGEQMDASTRKDYEKRLEELNGIKNVLESE